MTAATHSEANRDNPLAAAAVVISALVIAGFSARPYAGSFHDGSRLATVECLVDYHTLAIENSIFVKVPPGVDPGAPAPYDPAIPILHARGTLDRIYVNGHFYSHQPPVPSLWMAGVYQVLQWSTGLTARSRPDLFCYWITLGSSGLAYVAAIWCVYRLGRPLRLGLSLRLLLTASFGLATIALPFAEFVNNHILLLGVAAALCLQLAWLAEDTRAGRRVWRRLVVLGVLTGLGYAIDLAAGPLLLVCALALVGYRCRQILPVAVFLLGTLPGVTLHHAFNYAIGGTLKPVSAVPEYFAWPGSVFNAANMTGVVNHTPGNFLFYAIQLLISDRGFLGFNFPLWLACVGLVALLRRHTAELPEVLFALCWCASTWLLYALASNNFSGGCISIRWFVPLLAPGYYVIAVFLREHPRQRWTLLVLSVWGAVFGVIMWQNGPWAHSYDPLPHFRQLQAAALGSWFLLLAANAAATARAR